MDHGERSSTLARAHRPDAVVQLREDREDIIQRRVMSALSRRGQAADVHSALEYRAGGESPVGSGNDPRRIAAAGLSGGPGQLPHAQKIQALFGKHDVSGVESHVGGPVASASDALGAKAYAMGNSVAFAEAPDLHTAAHEAAHVVQQKAGVSLASGMGHAGDPYERHADAVADAVVAGRSAEALLDSAPGGGASSGVQAKSGGGAGRGRETDSTTEESEDDELAEVLGKVDAMIAWGDNLGYEQAALNLGHWRDGSGATRRMPASAFQNERFIKDHLGGKALEKFEAGAKRRVDDGTLSADSTTASMQWTDSVNAPLNSDLWFALGGFTIRSDVQVLYNPAAGTVTITRWTCKASDRYDWDAGKMTLIPGIGRIDDADIKLLEEAGHGAAFDVESESWTVTDASLVATFTVHPPRADQKGDEQSGGGVDDDGGSFWDWLPW